MVAAAVDAVIDVLVVIVEDNPLEEGVAVVRALSGTGLMADLFSGARVGCEVGFGLGFGLGFSLGYKFFDSESSFFIVVVVRDNPLAEGVAVVGAGSGMGLTSESLSRARAGREVGFGLGFDLGFKLFNSESSSLDELLFLYVLFPLFLLLFSAPPPSVVVAAVSTVVFTT